MYFYPRWLEHIQIVLPANTKVVAHIWPLDAFPFLHPNSICRSYSFSPGYVGEHKCTAVGVGLLVCLWSTHSFKDNVAKSTIHARLDTCIWRKTSEKQFYKDCRDWRGFIIRISWHFSKVIIFFYWLFIYCSNGIYLYSFCKIFFFRIIRIPTVQRNKGEFEVR